MVKFEVLYWISHGMYIVSAASKGRYNGQIVDALSQVSATPPKLAVSINKKNLTHQFIYDSRAFAVSILEKNTPLKFIGRFGFRSGREFDKFKDIDYKIGITGAPVVLENALGYMEAEVEETVDAGTHTLFIARVVDAQVLKDGEPMTYAYYRDVKGGRAPKTAPTYVEREDEGEVKEMKKYRCRLADEIERRHRESEFVRKEG